MTGASARAAGTRRWTSSESGFSGLHHERDLRRRFMLDPALSDQRGAGSTFDDWVGELERFGILVPFDPSSYVVGSTREEAIMRLSTHQVLYNVLTCESACVPAPVSIGSEPADLWAMECRIGLDELEAALKTLSASEAVDAGDLLAESAWDRATPQQLDLAALGGLADRIADQPGWVVCSGVAQGFLSAARRARGMLSVAEPFVPREVEAETLADGTLEVSYARDGGARMQVSGVRLVPSTPDVSTLFCDLPACGGLEPTRVCDIETPISAGREGVMRQVAFFADAAHDMSALVAAADSEDAPDIRGAWDRGLFSGARRREVSEALIAGETPGPGQVALGASQTLISARRLEPHAREGRTR